MAMSVGHSHFAAQLHDPLGTSAFIQTFVKDTPHQFDYVSQPIQITNFGSHYHLNIMRHSDLVLNAILCVDLPALQAVESGYGGGVDGKNSQGFATPSCTAGGSCSNDDLRSKIQYASSKLISKFNAQQDLSPSEVDEVNAAYSSATGFSECAYASECPCDSDDFNGGTYAYYTNSTGIALVNSVALVIGGSTIDTLYRDYIAMYEELTGYVGARLVEMINRCHSMGELICKSQKPMQLHLPLMFFFGKSTHMALPLGALAFHQCSFKFQFADLKELIVVSKPSVNVVNLPTLKASLTMRVAYLGAAEREFFQTKPYSQIITQTQASMMQSAGRQFHTQLHFSLPVTSLMVAVRRPCNTAATNWFNYSGFQQQDPIQGIQLSLNNALKYNESGAFSRTVEPYHCKCNLPTLHQYLVSFALDPLNDRSQTQGFVNFSKIDSVTLNLRIQPEISTELLDIMIFATSLNVLQYKDGLVGLVYVS
jgi:hypothetical protein